MELSVGEFVYILFIIYFCRISFMHYFEHVFKVKGKYEKWFNIPFLIRYAPFVVSVPVLIVLVIIGIYLLNFYLAVFVIIPLLCFIFLMLIITIFLSFLLGFSGISWASLIYLTCLISFLIYAHSKLFQKIYIKILILFNKVPNSEFSTSFFNKYSKYILEKHSLSFQVYILYGAIYLLINVIGFTDGLFDVLYTKVSRLLESIKFLEDSTSEILIVIEVVLSTAFIKEALVTFAIFDFIIREFRINFSKK